MAQERPQSGLQIGLEAMPCGYCQVRSDSTLSIVYANRLFYATYGYTPEEAADAGFNAISFINYPGDWPSCKAAVREGVLTGRESFMVETKAVHRTGRVLWVQVRCSPDPAQSDRLNCVILDVTEQVNTIERLRRGDEERQLLLQHTGRFVFRYYLASRIITLSPDASEELGLPLQIQGAPESVGADQRCTPESLADYMRFFGEMRAGSPSGSVVIRFRNHTGEYVWYSCAFSLVYGPDGAPQHAVVSFEDVSVQREKELAYEKWSQYNQSQMRDAVVYYECNLTRNTLDKIDGSTAFQFPPEVLGSYDDVLRYVVDEVIWHEDREKYEQNFLRGRLLEHYQDGKRELILECRRKDQQGKPFWVLVTVQILPDPYSDDVKAFLLVKNIDKEKRHELELRARSQQDPLTGCLNRSAFEEQMDTLLTVGAAGRHALVMLDIDHFKYLNDTMGHQYGDQVLVETAKRLRGALRGQDMIGRLGGDEFVLCLRDLPEGLDLEDRAAGLCRSLCQAVEGRPPVTASIGVSLSPRDGSSFGELYRKADQALYEAKRQGRGCSVLYQPGRTEDDPLPPASPIDPPEPSPSLTSDEAALELGRQLESTCYRTLLELSGAVLIEYDARTRNYYVSPGASRFAFAKNLGKEENHFFLTPECVHPYDWPLAEAISRAVRQGASSTQSFIHLQLANGEFRRCQLVLTVLRDGPSAVSRSFISVRDVDVAV